MRRRLLPLTGLTLFATQVASCTTFDTSRTAPPRGTTGEEVYAVICDRAGAQALRDDLTGNSFHALCHKDSAGNYADKVDVSKLPTISGVAYDHDGKPVDEATQNATRAHGIARIEALAHRRTDLITALDATIPDVQVPVKDTLNADPKLSCNAPAGVDTDKLGRQLADMISRFAPLYDDGTVPQSTESLARLVMAFGDPKHPEYRKSWSRFDARKGYRPTDIALGAARPVVSYPRLRDFSNASLSVLSADSKPYDPAPKLDDSGKRIPVPGPAYEPFSKLLEAAHFELRDTTADPMPGLLGVTVDPQTGRSILSRPRGNLEFMQSLFYVTDASFGQGESRFIVRRDVRGYAQLAGGKVVSPFVDKDGDGLPDVDDLGAFVTSDRSTAPGPFDYFGAQKIVRDQFGRAAPDGKSLTYDYIDTSHTFAAQMVTDMLPLTNPDPMAKHETLTDAIAGAYVIMGARDGSYMSEKKYGSDVVKYNQFHGENSPMLDLVYAIMQILGDSSADDTLAMSKTLLTNNVQETARITGAMLNAKKIADAHPEASLPATSTFWDENLDTIVKIAAEPGLLEDMLTALADPASENLGKLFGSYANFKDDITYDKNNLNGPPVNLTTKDSSEPKTPVDRNAPITGLNRSGMQRFLQMVNDATGVTACNKEGAILHAKGVPILGSGDICSGTLALCSLLGTRPWHECEVFKIENMAAFYLDAIVGKANLYFRPGVLRNGIAGIGKATVDMIEQSSGIGLNANDTYGFYDGTGTSIFHPRPQWLNRLVFFDVQNDSQNATTQSFLTDLNGPYIGSSVCPERVIDDPDPTAADASPDGKVHGLRSCANGDWIQQRNKGALFQWEEFGFYDTMKPLLSSFVNHGREDLFLELANATVKHYNTKDATASECKIVGGKPCVRDGLANYEPLLAELLKSDVIPALVNITRALTKIQVPHCDTFDATSKLCTKTENLNGVQVLARTTRAMVDPKYAASIGLKDRQGNVTALRNDGTTNPQVTPAYLLTGALSSIDKSFADYAAAHPDDKDRLTQWRRARSQLVDQFITVQGTGTGATFVNPTLPKLSPAVLDLLRAQLFAHCADTFGPKQTRCAWARDELVSRMEATVKGPVFAGLMDMTDAIRKDDNARKELLSLLHYLLDAASKNESLPAILASTNDIVQILQDDENMTPFYHFMSEGVDISRPSADGKSTNKSIIDAQMALLAKVSGKAYDTDGTTERCDRELDPNQVLTVALTNVVTPMSSGPQKGRAPLEVIIDVIADVNRVAPEQAPTNPKLNADDYTNIATNVNDFLIDPEHGLEQFYEVIRKGTGAD